MMLFIDVGVVWVIVVVDSVDMVMLVRNSFVFIDLFLD